ncbi:MAG: ABC transporter permease [Ktedonobacterales bacterium]
MSLSLSGFTAALWAEALKARRSIVLWLTALAIALAPLVGALFMLILKDPDLASRAGLLTTKAQARAAAADWPTYFSLLEQSVAIGGFVVFGFVATWLFGREYSDRTVKDLLALPTTRQEIVTAKYIVLIVWSTTLTVLVYALGLAAGALVGLPGWSLGLALAAAGQLAVTAGLTVALVTPFAWVASAGKGYLLPVGAMFLAIFLAQVIAAIGLGPYFPWSVPALTSGVAGPAGQTVGPLSYLLVVLTGLAGIAATAAWWRFADQT